MSGRAPLLATLAAVTPAVAANADKVTVIGEAPWAGVITGVTYIPVATITGADTESRTFNVHNRGDDGNDTTVAATLAMVASVNAADYDEREIPLSGTAANLVVAAGDILTWQSLHIGTTGLADPGGNVHVEISRT